MKIQVNRKSKISLIDQIYQEFAERIRSNLLTAGEPLPSIRKLAHELKVSIVTIHRAYALLMKDGLVVSVQGKGMFVNDSYRPKKELLTSTPSPFEWQRHVTDYIHRAQLIQYMKASSPIQFATSVIYPKLLPVKQLRDETIKIVTNDPTILTKLGEIQGDFDLRTGMQQYLKQLHSMSINVENIIITSGVQQGIDLVARSFIGPGDVVLMESPCYTGAIDVMRSRGASIIPLPIDEHGLMTRDLESLCEKLRPKMIYTNPSFQNPTGTVLSKQRRKELVAIAEIYGIIILEDDAISELYFDNTPPPQPIANWDSEGHVIYLKGLSKPLSPGYRIAALVASGFILDKLIAAKVMTDIGSPLLTQKAILSFIRSKRMSEHIIKLQIALEVRRNRLIDILSTLLGELISFQPPGGGLNIWMQLPETISSEKLYISALEQNVAFLPGSACFINSLDNQFLRLSFSAVSEKELDEGVERLAKLIKFEDKINKKN